MDVKRYFVSPEESGQICLLACMLGENREIFIPKLKEAQMMTFDSIAISLLKAQGYDALLCNSDKEALRKIENLVNGSKEYPVYFSISDTSGEKTYEEFYTVSETVDMARFESLGVIVGKKYLNGKKLIIFLKS